MEDEKSMENVDVALATCSGEHICHHNLDFDLLNNPKSQLYTTKILKNFWDKSLKYNEK